MASMMQEAPVTSISHRCLLAVTANKYNPESQAVYMQDGGELAEYPLASMAKEAWDDFQAEFLK